MMNRLVVVLFSAALFALLALANGAPAQHSVTTFEPVGELVGHTGWINDFAFSPDGKLIATASRDSTVRVWDVQALKEVKKYWGEYYDDWIDPTNGYTYPDHLYRKMVYNVTFSPDGQLLVFATGGKIISHYKLENEQYGVFYPWGYRYWAPVWMAFSPDGQWLMVGVGTLVDQTGGWIGGIYADDLKGHKKNGIVHYIAGDSRFGHGNLSQPILSPDGKLVIALDYRDIVLTEYSKYYGDETEVERIKVIPDDGKKRRLMTVAINPDGKLLAFSENKGALRLFNLQTREITAVLIENGNDDYFAGAWSLAFSPDGKLLAAGFWRGDLRLWDIITGQEIAQLTEGEGYRVVSIRFSPDGKLLAALFEEEKVLRLWGVKVTAVEEENTAVVPQGFALRQNYPNPFNPETVISYELAEATDVRLAIYDLSGRQVRVLVQGRKQAGFYAISWNGRNEQGQEAATGVYLYRLTAGTFIKTKKMVLMR